METLQSLSLDHNRIAKLGGMYNVTFQQLGYLYLRHNKISMINVQLLQFPELRHMHLHGNELKHLEDMRFCTWGFGNGFTLSLEIEENPWHCDGNMGLEPTECVDPWCSRGARWGSGLNNGIASQLCRCPYLLKSLANSCHMRLGIVV